ncbi:N-acetylglucosaminyldiphospho-UDP N-acetyl-beta-D-mannosaminyltransferase [Bacillus atrophaeus]|uniref:N-acetylglucosaminyldiphosphoundecaprenol N-acetyl-beta-D-mannosaminyltransferase n=1 Tax=Bacillus atrophaeus (strain 1942) TaxID=720555 RepID=A0ABM5M3W0_BACA1|nr:N-acetylglucosaminyldiphosphoundecaprenol N-acetyl-beta-D-mannosaminyltransferase [Bacillus atrophaeus 1942]AMR64281.1 N-acetylglucosaminyldiphospho-UDP N-acetyl-beta-D-mannosaminyltransferase [Bacillus subtilis subsp. globigii]EIM09940.1 N-acetylglucosaminyldiphosphoundecaprenol N-acetyl-beta-D-mannosaminyltransferase [Bacillus atrophaeus C89]MBG9758784.1 N-acetylglucosaminyldiphospho-UDP N-acetyl-beta-D-mannosaminyltransferase [Bacillus atrophaeus]
MCVAAMSKERPHFLSVYTLRMYRLITNSAAWIRMLSIPKYVTTVFKHERASAKPQYAGQVKNQPRHL